MNQENENYMSNMENSISETEDYITDDRQQNSGDLAAEQVSTNTTQEDLKWEAPVAETKEPPCSAPASGSEHVGKRHSAKAGKTGVRMTAGLLICSLLLGTAGGFGGGALWSYTHRNAETVSSGLQIPGGQSRTGQTPQQGVFPGGQADNNMLPFGKNENAPEFGGGENAFSEDQSNTTKEDIEQKGFPFGNAELESGPEKESAEDESGTEPSDNEDKGLSASPLLSGTSLTTEEIVSAAADSVVEITTESVQTGSFMRQYVSSGAGSGVIVSEDGYILTNNHVISGSSSITVTLRSGTSYQAELVGRDETLDAALLKIDADGLVPASFGDSDELNLGEKVVAIGNPLGQLGGSVTEGIISSLNREITLDGQTMTLLQTDAAINPGNSGGGLFNDRGQLIGLVVAKSAGENVEGIGFAIPINDIRDILDDLAEYGYTKGRAYIGISIVDLSSSEMAMMSGVSEPGIYVSSVEENSQAAAAGIQAGDRIVSVNGSEVSSTDDIKDAVSSTPIGDTVILGIQRGDQLGEAHVIVGEYKPL